MAVLAAGAPQCRFCLEAEATRQNPLIAPCDCRGSVRFIHSECLRRWIAQDPGHNAVACTICHSPFALWALPRIEKIFPLSYLEDLVLNYAGYIGMGLQYVVMVDSWGRMAALHDSTVAYRACGNALLLVHILYILVFWKNATIRNWDLYRTQLQRGVVPILLGSHAAFLASFLVYRDPIQPLFAYMILNRYWTEHVKLLRGVNRLVLQI